MNKAKSLDQLWVIKLGGSLLDAEGPPLALIQSLSDFWMSGHRFVVVHGGGKSIDRELEARGIPRRTHNGLRITDDATLPVVVSVLTGLVNKTLVARLTSAGMCAAGLSGADGAILKAEYLKLDDGVNLGHVGRIVGTNTILLRTLLDTGILPVVASVAIGPDAGLLNVNADSAAVALAVGLHADRLVFLTDVEGLNDSNGKVLPTITPSEVQTLSASGVVTGGMLPKLAASVEAVREGVAMVMMAGPSRYRSVFNGGMGGTSIVAD